MLIYLKSNSCIESHAKKAWWCRYYISNMINDLRLSTVKKMIYRVDVSARLFSPSHPSTDMDWDWDSEWILNFKQMRPMWEPVSSVYEMFGTWCYLAGSNKRFFDHDGRG